MAVSDLIKNVMDELENVMHSKSVIGDPITSGDYTVIPVSKVSFGFGAGGGGSNQIKKGKNCEGVGGGWNIEPLAFLVVGIDGARLYSLKQDETIMGKLFDMAPKVAETIKDYVETRDTGVGSKEAPSDESTDQ